MNEMISIIVPIYNVEKYLTECVESLLKQTYSDIEIILINDGSTDSSGKICEKYAKIDDRVKVIHKENGGVSSARNEGIRLSRSKYITFVDPDDYVSCDFIEKLYRLLKDSNADISICNYITVGNNIRFKGKLEKKIINQRDAMTLLVKDEEMPSYLWNKMFRVELFDGLRFMEGYRYEDVRMMHLIFLRANRVAVTDEPFYYYRVREGSITSSTLLNNSEELINALEDRCKDLANTVYWEEAYITEMIQIRRILSEIVITSSRKEEFYYRNLKKLKRMYKSCKKKMSVSQKIKFRIFLMIPTLYAKYLYAGGNNG